MDNLVVKLLEKNGIGSGGSIGIGNDIGSGCDINRPNKSGNADNVNQHQAASRSNLKNVSHGDIPENTKCKLLHWCGDGVVAEGRIASTDSTVKVHHVPLVGSCWKVWVDRVLVEQVDLIRPNSEMIFLDDAVGSTVAWFSKFIVLYD
ncbi:uncharacterized protein LOC142548126 isoform X2 [Primulina tabacum]|uniref:uncharacterized protein LOC142548126 isoform X2 n=1 Tax=Primulina tabacum TaxID=48773 RepID=UPI003F597598